MLISDIRAEEDEEDEGEEVEKKPSIQELLEERDAKRQQRAKFHGEALEWSRLGENANLFDIEEFAKLFDHKSVEESD